MASALDETIPIMSLAEATEAGYRHRDEAAPGEVFYTFSFTDCYLGRPDPRPDMPPDRIRVAIIDPAKMREAAASALGFIHTEGKETDDGTD